MRADGYAGNAHCAEQDATLLAPAPTTAASALAADLAVVAFRAGAPVLVEAPDGPALLVQALDGLGSAELARFRSLAPRGHRVVISHRRLEAAPDDDGPFGMVSVALRGPVVAATLRALAGPGLDAGAVPGVLGEPQPVAADGGEAAAVAIAKLAGLLPAVLVAPASWPASARPSAVEGLAILAVEAAAVLRHLEVSGAALRAMGGARVPLAVAEDTRLVVFRSPGAGIEHVAILVGRPESDSAPLVRLHSACFTGDVLGSLRCDCGEQLRGALARFAEEGGGVLLYLAQEGRGIGLLNKMRAYQLQDDGLDTVDANEELGFASDERVYHPAAAMLRELGIRRLRLLTNNPEKVAGLAECGLAVVERVPHSFPANCHNAGYLRTKALRSGHLLPLAGDAPIPAATNGAGAPAADIAKDGPERQGTPGTPGTEVSR